MFFSVASVMIVVLSLTDFEVVTRADDWGPSRTGNIRVSRRDNDIRSPDSIDWVDMDVQSIHGHTARIAR